MKQGIHSVSADYKTKTVSFMIEEEYENGDPGEVIANITLDISNGLFLSGCLTEYCRQLLAPTEDGFWEMGERGV